MIPVNGLNPNKMIEVLSVNYFAFREIVKFFSKQKYSDGGSIVAISSVSSFAGWKGAFHYIVELKEL